ncbi:MAG: BON domain-containing protein [Azoarcus sp.]|jgi:osmotically-inducible protein OsmY|nr:BON domain-containing protein [Azoarcus sp.]
MKIATTLSAVPSARRVLLVGMIVIAGLPLLQGCVPVMFAGIGTTALVVSDRRSTGAVVDDEAIEWKTADQMRQHFGSLNHINVTSYNRNVLLTGEVQDENVKTEAERLAGAVTNVRAVVNELVVAPASGLASRGNDSAITANVKARFLPNKVFSANRVKVVTEAGTVFLLGIVTLAEADHAVEIARTSKGVDKVVKVFEYINESEAQTMDSRKNDSSPPEAP